MSRVVGILFAAALSAAPLSAARSADRSPPSGGVRVTVDACRPPRVETVRYEEQVCQKGAGGYTTCRWVDREHAVATTGTCEPVDTAERTRPATRGAFPAQSRSPRG